MAFTSDDLFAAVDTRVAARLKRMRVRLGTIDSSYAGSGDPGIVFDGEGSASTKSYRCAAGYVPGPGDRVWLVPVGSTYLVAGGVDVVGGQDRARPQLTSYTTDSSYVSAGTEDVVLSLSATLRAYRAYEVSFGLRARATVDGYARWRIRNASATGTVYANWGGIACRTVTSSAQATGYLCNGSGTDVSRDLKLCLAAVGGDMRQEGSADGARYLMLRDVGPCSDYDHAYDVS